MFQNGLQSQMENLQKYRNHFERIQSSLDNIIDETWFVTDIEECMTNVGEIFDQERKFMVANQRSPKL